MRGKRLRIYYAVAGRDRAAALSRARQRPPARRPRLRLLRREPAARALPARGRAARDRLRGPRAPGAGRRGRRAAGDLRRRASCGAPGGDRARASRRGRCWSRRADRRSSLAAAGGTTSAPRRPRRRLVPAGDALVYVHAERRPRIPTSGGTVSGCSRASRARAGCANRAAAKPHWARRRARPRAGGRALARDEAALALLPDRPRGTLADPARGVATASARARSSSARSAARATRAYRGSRCAPTACWRRRSWATSWRSAGPRTCARRSTPAVDVRWRRLARFREAGGRSATPTATGCCSRTRPGPARSAGAAPAGHRVARLARLVDDPACWEPRRRCAPRTTGLRADIASALERRRRCAAPRARRFTPRLVNVVSGDALAYLGMRGADRVLDGRDVRRRGSRSRSERGCCAVELGSACGRPRAAAPARAAAGRGGGAVREPPAAVPSSRWSSDGVQEGGRSSC